MSLECPCTIWENSWLSAAKKQHFKKSAKPIQLFGSTEERAKESDDDSHQSNETQPQQAPAMDVDDENPFYPFGGSEKYQRVNPITKRQYPTPNFNSDVLHPDNCALFRKVGLRAQVVLSDTAAWPKALKRLKTLKDPIVWDLDFTTECAKKSFRSYKKQWQAQATIKGREKAEEKEKRDRHTQRRVLKSEQIKKISDAVAEENDMDTMFICDSTHPEYLSDEMSGPDSDAETPETHENWKFRMATIAKLPKDPASLKNTHFLEVLVSEWRAEAYTDFVHSLQRRKHSSTPPDPSLL
ncbi:hypothetical protein B0H14DRAFT_3712181 [Mycena olivaceomarginata]|nr:hypothetical protein B0H14DRAFT_3712181 [Mycena olivaceomarginata]